MTQKATDGGTTSIVEAVFLAYYTMELVLKLYVHRWFFFVNASAGWNAFDLFLVCVSLLEQVVMPALKGEGESVDLKFLRVVRLLKMTKVLRMIKVLQFIHNLRLFVACLIGCGSSLFWAVVIILLILVLFSMFLVQAMTMYIFEFADDMDQEFRQTAASSFGSVHKCMITLFMCVSGGTDWIEPYNLVRRTGELNGCVFLFFIFFFVIAVWNIVTSIFIERTMELAKPDVDGLMLLKRRRDIDDARELMKLCTMVDKDMSGTISSDEFEFFIQNEAFRQYFDVRGIDVKDAAMFFQMLCAAAEVTGDEVDVDTFIGGCLRLKGVASSIDVQTLAFEAKLMHALQKRFMDFAEARFASLDEDFAALRGVIMDMDARVKHIPFLHVPCQSADVHNISAASPVNLNL